MRDVHVFEEMVMAVLAQVGNMLISKAAMSRGISNFVLVVYSNALSALIFFPASFIFHRSERPPLTFSILCTLFLLSLIGGSAQMFTFAGIRYSSATLGTAMNNLIPAFTFILAIIFRFSGLHRRIIKSGYFSIGARLGSILGFDTKE